MAFVLYCAWIVGPYIRSVLVRDAAVSAWVHRETSPIDGQLISELPGFGHPIPPEGWPLTIQNKRLFDETQAIMALRRRVEHSGALSAELEDYLARLRQIAAEQANATARHAELFLADLDSALSLIAHELDLLRETADADGAVSDLREAELSAERARIELRKAAAADGVFVNADGSTPRWAGPGDVSLEVEIARAQMELRDAAAVGAEAAAALQSEQREFDQLREAVLIVPGGAVIEAVDVDHHETVAAGQVLLSWIDCAALLVDVPVSDAELPLILPGMPAEIIVEGEATEWDGTVLLTRGSAATLDDRTLAAIAKGRSEGVAQVIVAVDAKHQADECPVGRAAYVGFPGVGLLEILRARLRL